MAVQAIPGLSPFWDHQSSNLESYTARRRDSKCEPAIIYGVSAWQKKRSKLTTAQKVLWRKPRNVFIISIAQIRERETLHLETQVSMKSIILVEPNLKSICLMATSTFVPRLLDQRPIFELNDIKQSRARCCEVMKSAIFFSIFAECTVWPSFEFIGLKALSFRQPTTDREPTLLELT